MLSNSKHLFYIVHLYNRAAFGISPDELAIAQNKSIEELVNDLFAQSIKYDNINEVDKSILTNANILQMDKDERKELFQKGLLFTKKLNATWFNKLVNDKSVLREKMTLFWSNHFACRSLNATFQQGLNNICRDFALGSFKDLLVEVSKSPAMLQFLSNQQNKKQHPNENFAREVMELFTLGRGNYSEQDIKEAARAFTGWSFNLRGEFQFRLFQHDNDSKTVLGQTGNLDGDDVLQILLQQKQCAYFITKKIYKAFVNQTPDEKFIAEATDFFYQNNYHIEKLMRYIFMHPHFYEDKNIATQIKSPIELMVGMLRNIPVEFDNPAFLLNAQKVLGQILFLPPNVAGWQGGTNWIDSSSLLFRMRLPYVLFKNETPIAQAKDEADDQLMDKNEAAKKNKMMTAHADWNNFYQHYNSSDAKEIFEKMKIDLMGKAAEKIDFKLLENNLNENNLVKSIAIRLMEMPEFQLC